MSAHACVAIGLVRRYIQSRWVPPNFVCAITPPLGPHRPLGPTLVALSLGCTFATLSLSLSLSLYIFVYLYILTHHWNVDCGCRAIGSVIGNPLPFTSSTIFLFVKNTHNLFVCLFAFFFLDTDCVFIY